MQNYYHQIHEYLQKVLRQVIQTDRGQIIHDGVSVDLLEYVVLKIIQWEQGQTYQEIMAATGRTRNEVTAVLRRLIKQQLIQKDPSSEDRRVRQLVLTELGTDFVNWGNRQEEHFLTEVLNDLSFNEEKAVLKFLVKLEMQFRQDEIAALRRTEAAKLTSRGAGERSGANQ